MGYRRECKANQLYHNGGSWFVHDFPQQVPRAVDAGLASVNLCGIGCRVLHLRLALQQLLVHGPQHGGKLCCARFGQGVGVGAWHHCVRPTRRTIKLNLAAVVIVSRSNHSVQLRLLHKASTTRCEQGHGCYAGLGGYLVNRHAKLSKGGLHFACRDGASTINVNLIKDHAVLVNA